MEQRRSARLRFAPDLPVQRRSSLVRLLTDGVTDAARFDGYRRGVKEFFRLESDDGPVFVKTRRFPRLLKQLKNAVRRTKDEREFEHLLALRLRGVPCPAPLAVAHLGRLRIRETRLAMEFVVDAASLRRTLLDGDAASREAVLDRLVAFLRLLRDRGVVHGDLHWENLLVRPSPAGPEFLLIDALHVRLVDPPPAGADEFAATVQWFVGYMVHQDAPPEIVEAVLDRLASLDLPPLADRAAVAAQARRIAESLQ